MRFNSKQYRAARLSIVAAIGALLLSSRVYADPDGAHKTGDEKDASSIFGTQTDIAVGMGVGFDQRYMGSKDYRSIVWPAIAVHRGIFFADTLRGAGAEWQSDFGLYLADALNYDVGRGTATNVFRPGSSNLTGLGEVKGALTNTVTIAQGLATWFAITAQAERALDGSQRGNQYQLGVESTLSLTPKDTVILDLDAKFGDRQYNQTYFGVTPSQSNSSGYAQFAPGSGVYAYFLSGNWKHSFDRNWSTRVIVTATSYTDKVAEGPIVESKFGVAAFTSLNYSF